MTFDEFLEHCDKNKLNKLTYEIIENSINDLDQFFYISDNEDYNQEIYNNLVDDYDIYDYIMDVDPNTFTRFLQETFDIDEDFSKEFQNYIANYAGKYEAAFEKTLKNFIIEHSKDPGFNTNGEVCIDDFDTDYDDFSADEVIKDVDTLIGNNDNIGDKFEILEDIDYFNRESSFMYLDGEIFEGEAGWSHSQIINHYLKDNDQETITDDYDENKINSRPLVKTIREFTGAEHVGFGHILNNMAFIETIQNCSVEDVKNALQKEYNFDKIYMYVKNYNSRYVQRLAKRKL